jgi:hypothetical protein
MRLSSVRKVMQEERTRSEAVHPRSRHIVTDDIQQNANGRSISCAKCPVKRADACEPMPDAIVVRVTLAVSHRWRGRCDRSSRLAAYKVFKALSDPTRRRLLQLLRERTERTAASPSLPPPCGLAPRRS